MMEFDAKKKTIFSSKGNHTQLFFVQSYEIGKSTTSGRQNDSKQGNGSRWPAVVIADLRMSGTIRVCVCNRADGGEEWRRHERSTEKERKYLAEGDGSLHAWMTKCHILEIRRRERERDGTMNLCFYERKICQSELESKFEERTLPNSCWYGNTDGRKEEPFVWSSWRCTCKGQI